MTFNVLLVWLRLLFIRRELYAKNLQRGNIQNKSETDSPDTYGPVSLRRCEPCLRGAGVPAHAAAGALQARGARRRTGEREAAPRGLHLGRRFRVRWERLSRRVGSV